MKVSIVIPAHNEGMSIGQAVDAFLTGLTSRTRALLHEFIIVENGSTDDTLARARDLARAWPHLVKVLSIERGSYGEALKAGIAAAEGSHICILECDFLDEVFLIESCEALEQGGCEIVVGSKRHKEAIDARPFKRRVLTYWFNTILKLAFGYPGTDTHGLKTIESTAAKRLCGLSVTTDEVFQTELVLLGWRLGYRVQELPVRIRENRPTPVRIARRFPKVMNILFELRRSLSRFPQQAQSTGWTGMTIPKSAK